MVIHDSKPCCFICIHVPTYLHIVYMHIFMQAGGERNVTIRGSPYDFRYASTGAYEGQWLSMMQSLVEETYANAHNERVVLISHSLGCLYTLWFLNQMTAAWKDTYIKRWVPTSGVFGGAGEGVLHVVWCQPRHTRRFPYASA